MPGHGTQGWTGIERALRVLSAGNRVLIRATDELQLLDDMCRVIVDVGGYAVAVASYLGHDEGKSLPTMACAGIEISVVEGFSPWLPMKCFEWLSDSRSNPTAMVGQMCLLYW